MTSESDRAVWRIDPETEEPEAIIPVGKRPWELTTGAGSVWLTDADAGTVTRIDPRTNEVVARIKVGYKPHGVAVAGGFVWVAVALRNPF